VLRKLVDAIPNRVYEIEGKYWCISQNLSKTLYYKCSFPIHFCKGLIHKYIKIFKTGRDYSVILYLVARADKTQVHDASAAAAKF
jgi:hypothetical protein